MRNVHKYVPLSFPSGVGRTPTSLYRRYYHLPLFASDPGASGATWTAPDANGPGGYQLDAAGELLYMQGDVHSDWDGASDLKLELTFQVNVDNTGGNAGDTVDIKIVCYYKGETDVASKTQTLEDAITVGASAQYKQFKHEFTIDWDKADNVVEVGDVIGFIVNLETDSSEVDDITINDCSFYYQTTHIGIESGDV